MKDTILIVDDSELIRVSLRVLFQKQYHIKEAKNGKEALDILRKKPVSAVLMDLYMPIMDGIELLTRIRESDVLFSIPVVVISSSMETEKLVEAFQAGATDYITKPFHPQITVLRVNNALAANRRMRKILDEEKVLRQRAELDLLTNLYNKVTAEEKIKMLLASLPGTLNALFLFDIDDFKQVNDTMGHARGDHVIKIVADLISSHFRAGDIIGRVGGDEFVAFMMNIPSRSVVVEKAEELTAMLKQKPSPTLADVTFSIGVSFSDGADTSFSDLFYKADQALYQTKNREKGSYTIYDE